MSDLHFQGYAVHDTKKYTDFKLIDFTCAPPLPASRSRG